MLKILRSASLFQQLTMLTFNKDKTEVTVSAVPDKRQKGSDGSKGFEIVG